MNDTAGKAPGWAPFFSPEEWAVFVATLAGDLSVRGLEHDIDADEGSVRFAVRPGVRVPEVLGLQNIAQVCHSRPRSGWASAIRHHFDVAFDAKDGLTADALAGDWSRARDVVKLRLYEQESVPGVPVVTWPIADGLVAVLSFDLPDTVISVRREDRERWSIDDDALFRTALDNVKRGGPLHKGAVDIGKGTSLWVLEGTNEFFAATHALLLDEYLGDVPAPHGAVVAIPHRHVVVYHPIDDLRVVRAIQQMIASTNRMYAEGPGSISADLYWWRKGEPLVRLPCEHDAEGVRFAPPPEFVDLLDSLSPAPDER
jgi:hypothetical protein